MGISFKEVSHLYPTSKKKTYTVALEHINLNISAKNEFVALVGKTGSGKSTLMEHMNALILPSTGTVQIFEHTITPKKNKNPKLKQVRKRVGFVFQFPEYQLFEETVLKDIMFAGKNFGYKEEQAKTEAMKTAMLLKIEEGLLKRSPFNLSGGQMRKVAIAGILAYNPDIILLDEPTRGLDPKTAEEIMEILTELRPDVEFENEKKLIDDGILDSFDIVSLVGELNDAFDVSINVEDLLPENFNCVEAMVELIENLQEEE